MRKCACTRVRSDTCLYLYKLYSFSNELTALSYRKIDVRACQLTGDLYWRSIRSRAPALSHRFMESYARSVFNRMLPLVLKLARDHGDDRCLSV